MLIIYPNVLVFRFAKMHIIVDLFNLNKYHGFQFGSNNLDASLASVTCFQVSETRNQVTQDQIINAKI